MKWGKNEAGTLRLGRILKHRCVEINQNMKLNVPKKQCTRRDMNCNDKYVALK